jgi:hypothetical protein
MRGPIHSPAPMPLRFFPRDRQFWLYHCSAIAAGLAVTVGMNLAWGGFAAYEVSTSLCWVPLYTLAVLAFRWLYQRFGGQSVRMGWLIAWAVLYSAVAGVLTAALLQAALVTVFWDVFVAKYAAANLPLDFANFLFMRIREQGPQNQLFILVWSFMYISVTAVRRVRQAETHNLRLQNNLKEAQLSSLSNQLNPHFLFNSLNNIRFMIHEDARRADSMITVFSEILRYSLESSRSEKVNLGHELAIIDQYIAIVKVQLEERLAFSMQVDRSLHEALVPPMVLQMLTENAIKHGLEHLHAGGALSIAASVDGGKLVFDIGNDTPASANRKGNGMGIGLRNIEQRLALLYGERASLNVAHEGTRFNVRVVLPMERAA